MSSFLLGQVTIMGKTRKLKVALQSQQSRLKAKEKLSHAAQIDDRKASKNTKGKDKAGPSRRRTIPFRPTDKILLVGEGNFSFAQALVYNPPLELRSFPPSNLTATAYDSEQACYEKYADAQEIVARLREKDVEVLFGVDATRLEKTPSLKGRGWDRVVWNFPHAGWCRFKSLLTNGLTIL